MFRRQLFEAGEDFYQKEFLHAEDYELWCRLLHRTQAATLPIPLLIVGTYENDGISAIYRQEQAEMVTTISARQIRELLSHRALTLPEIKMLRRCYSPQQLTQTEMIFCPVMFELLKVFEQQPGIDPTIVRCLRRQWIKRLLATNAEQLGQMWVSGLFRSILRHDPVALLMAGLIHLPRRSIRRIHRFLLN